MSDLAPTSQDRQLVTRMSDLNREIVLGCTSIRAAGWKLASLIYEFVEDRGWEVLNGPGSSMEEWLAGPEIELKRTHVLRMLRDYRAFVIEHKVPLQELEGVSISKADVVLPAIRSGRVSVERGLADCRVLTRKDLVVEYGAARSEGFDAEAEAPMCECARCGQVHRSKS